ncbi:hypothetical protein F0562_008332 [Nyssa sinensis]|uniref:Uncharacterized protein n=1 Tax=Nyssa sinensis TaxID=561372 RepID=A0A5J5A5S5_9ASTE|nr:hypothetical protein F0562_008332 [Nyssa sinensis]
MKFFVEFSSCFGGAIVTPAAESAAPPPQEAVRLKSAGNGYAPRRTTRSRLTKVHSSTQWKPALSVISEDRLVSDAGRNNERMVRSEKKQSVKARSTEKVRSPNHGDDYRKSTLPMAIPACCIFKSPQFVEVNFGFLTTLSHLQFKTDSEQFSSICEPVRLSLLTLFDLEAPRIRSFDPSTQLLNYSVSDWCED